jgi:peptidoglycan/LPS O-acetylase OafA/YrhL
LANKIKTSERLISRHPSTNNATVLRGLAALSVLIIHYDGIGLRSVFNDGSQLDYFANTIVSLGIYGPSVFFLASGFALTASLSGRKIKISAFLINRIFRLLPLYGVVLTLFLCHEIIKYKAVKLFTVKNIFMHLTFLDVFSPEYFYSDPIGVLSSIPIEFWWSLLIPLLLLIQRKARFLEIPLFGSLIFLTFFLQKTFPSNDYLAAYGQNKWWVFGSCFYFGNIAFRFRLKIAKSSNFNFIFIATLMSVCLEAFRLNLVFTILSISFTYLIFGDTLKLPIKLSESINSFLLYIGTICYSVYLLHLPIRLIGDNFIENIALLNVFALITTVIASSITYLFIEHPLTKFGKKLSLRISS